MQGKPVRWCQQDSSEQATCHQRAAPRRKPGAAPRASAGCQPRRNTSVIERGQRALATCPFFHQINQAPRSNSSKTVQSKPCDSEKEKWHKKPKESLKKWWGSVSLDHLLPRLNSSIMYKHKAMRSSSVGRTGRIRALKADWKRAAEILAPKLVKQIMRQICLSECFKVICSFWMYGDICGVGFSFLTQNKPLLRSGLW